MIWIPEKPYNDIPLLPPAIELETRAVLDLWSSVTVKKAATGRGRSGKISPYGIKKLRELILELAVRGKLVPQEPNDEPASGLLERIANERASFVKEGKIKKQKTLSSITGREQQFELPSGWAKERFGNLAIIERGGSPRPIKSFLTDDPDGLNWIKIGDTDIGGKYVSSTAEKIIKDGLSKTRMVYPGDFLLTNSMSFGRPYITKIEGCIHDGWLRISPATLIDKDYLYWLLTSPFVKKALTDLAAGAVVQNLNSDKVRNVVLLVPPVEEQHRIVAKVDELMALCDKLEQQQTDSLQAHQTLVETLLRTLVDAGSDVQDAQVSREAGMPGATTENTQQAWNRIGEHFDTLFTTEASIDQLKQTILQLAVMGRLVPQDPNDEPASVLLKKIAAEKAQLIKDKKIKKQKPLPPIREDEKPFDLPAGWKWCRFDDICSLVTSGSRGWKEYYSDSGAIFIRSQDIKFDQLEFDNRAFVNLPENTEGKRTKVEQGDILVTITGANVGKAALIDTDLLETYVSQHVGLVRLVDMLVSPFIHKWLTGSLGGRQLLLGCSYGAKPGLNLLNIRELPVPVAPLSEMGKIVTKVEALLSLCDTLKTQLAASQTTQLQLADAVVKQAVA